MAGSLSLCFYLMSRTRLVLLQWIYHWLELEKGDKRKIFTLLFFFPFLLTWVWLFSLFLCSFGAALHFLGPNNWSNAKGIILRNVQSHPCIASRILDVSILNTSWANISKFTEALVKCHELSLPQKKMSWIVRSSGLVECCCFICYAQLFI